MSYSNFNSLTQTNEATMLYMAQIFVFKEEEYLGWDCFYKDVISVGSTPYADIRLDDKSVAKIHAMIFFKEDRLFVSPQSSEHTLQVNGKAVGSCKLKSLDVISIGSHRLKIKLVKISEISRLIDKEKRLSDAQKKDAYVPEIRETKEMKNPGWNWVEEEMDDEAKAPVENRTLELEKADNIRKSIS